MPSGGNHVVFLELRRHSRVTGPAAGGSVAKSHSFFSLLRKNGRPESGGAEQADAGKAGGRQKRGLRGLLGGVRWRRKDRRPQDSAPAGRAGAPGGLARPGSLTASLECVKALGLGGGAHAERK